jgi:hypothetical protein
VTVWIGNRQRIERGANPSQKRAAWAVGGLLVVLTVTAYFMGLQLQQNARPNPADLK